MYELNEQQDTIKQLDDYCKRVNQVLSDVMAELHFHSNPLIEVMRYTTLLGGKRLRPWLVYATGQMFDIRLNNLDIPAAAVEFIHTYSLVHDDLPAMDNDDLRRGQASCHVKFGEASAILVGDALQTLAFSILANKPMPDVDIQDRLAMISELAAGSGVTGMCGGQALDLAAAGCQISLKSLEQIHHYKTGALIQTSVRIGALAAGERGRAVLPVLTRYASTIGLAFQIQDDILNITGDSTRTGKRQGSDQKMGKNTYPAMLGLDKARMKTRELLAETESILDILAAQSYDISSLHALARFVIERDN